MIPVCSPPDPIQLEQLNTKQPGEDNKSLQEKCKALLDELDNDASKPPDHQGSALVDDVIDKKVDDKSNLKTSQVNPDDMQKIAYLTSLDQAKYNQEYRANLENLMNMGFYDFKKNLKLLQKHFNNLELVCQKILE